MGDLRHIDEVPKKGDLRRLQQGLVQIASELEEAELRIKEEIIEAARAGENDRIVDLVERWLREPPADVAKDLRR